MRDKNTSQHVVIGEVPRFKHYSTPRIRPSLCKLKPLNPPIMRSLSTLGVELLTQSFRVIHGL